MPVAFEAFCSLHWEPPYRREDSFL